MVPRGNLPSQPHPQSQSSLHSNPLVSPSPLTPYLHPPPRSPCCSRLQRHCRLLLQPRYPPASPDTPLNPLQQQTPGPTATLVSSCRTPDPPAARPACHTAHQAQACAHSIPHSSLQALYPTRASNGLNPHHRPPLQPPLHPPVQAPMAKITAWAAFWPHSPRALQTPLTGLRALRTVRPVSIVEAPLCS